MGEMICRIRQIIALMWACDPAETVMCLTTGVIGCMLLAAMTPLLVWSWIAPEEESAEEIEDDQ